MAQVPGVACPIGLGVGLATGGSPIEQV